MTKSRAGSDHGSGGGSDDGGNGCGSGSSLNAKGSSDNGSGTQVCTLALGYDVVRIVRMMCAIPG